MPLPPFPLRTVRRIGPTPLTPHPAHVSAWKLAEPGGHVQTVGRPTWAMCRHIAICQGSLHAACPSLPTPGPPLVTQLTLNPAVTGAPGPAARSS
ncbi:hypothetical protein HEK616_46170 [Streptomyces nigrescens]|uniref:Uncharacterized protein n=1 Tax=Streptomyces nigrescens TaxID=1920 RepID=A0ABN6R0T9_STRNI|nr:hypothetical protein HEK616_46170 [Streptomyces nigrescens]